MVAIVQLQTLFQKKNYVTYIWNRQGSVLKSMESWNDGFVSGALRNDFLWCHWNADGLVAIWAEVAVCDCYVSKSRFFIIIQ